ncbi:MAG: extracellular solute-binding protein [Treponema sp.]|jgi:multiple sugar transport system substrate-binding protein|nr:extracellular solute-binding protein [Treponema sp.]
MTIKPADRLLFIMALAALGIAMAVRLRLGKIVESPKTSKTLSLSVGVAEGGGLGLEELGILTAGYVSESRKINVLIGGGEDPLLNDIILTEGPLLGEKIAAGLFLPLDKFQRRTGQSPAVEKWVLPLVSSMDVLVYNIPLLKAAGFDRPPKTWTEFLDYARTVKAAVSGGTGGAGGRGAAAAPSPGVVYPFALGLSPRDPRGIRRDIFSWIRSSGLPLEQDGKPEFGGGRLYTEILEFFSLLNSEGLLSPGSFTAAGEDRIEEFLQGGIAMLIVSSRELQEIRGKMGDESIGITLVPQAAGYAGKPVLGLSTWYAGIRADSSHPDEAWTLLRHLKERSPFLAEFLGLTPGTGVYEPYISGDPLLDKAWDIYEAADTVEEFLELPGAGELEGVLRSELEALFRQNSPKSPAEAAAAVRRFWEQWEGPKT